ncbi:MAG: autotransporter domain-containing protein [Endomicrobium sp.]|nr:autotransporter domain-containing protein [Endomicrobium sp.]
MKKLISFIIFSVFMLFTVKTADAVDVSDYTSLNDAIKSSPSNPSVNDINLSTGIITQTEKFSDILNKTIKFKSTDPSGKTIIDANAHKSFISNQGSNLSFENIDFRNSHSDDNGGFLRVMASTVSFGGSVVKFTNGISEGQEGGGALSARNNSYVHFSSGVIFDSNTAYNYGGGFYSHRSTLVFDGDAHFINNTVEYSGGGFTADTNSNIFFNGHTVLKGNKTTENNGAGFFAHSASVNFNTAELENNVSLDNGGGFYAVQSNISFSGKAVFSGNSAKLTGGAASIGMYSDVRFDDEAHFLSNTATNGGGAIRISRSNLSFAKNAVFENNTSSLSGGAIGADHYATISFNDTSSFKNNKTDENGGAIYVHSGNLSLSDTIFEGNTAVMAGGAIYLTGTSFSEKAVLTINTSSETLFTGNKANNVSNAIYLDNYSSAEFNTASGASVQMRDAISASGYDSKIIISGAGDFDLYNRLDYADITLAAASGASFNLMSGARVNAGKLVIGNGTTFNSVNNAGDTINVEAVDIDGKLSLEISETGVHDKIISSGKVNIGSSAELEVTTDLTDANFRKKTYLLINTPESINGTFANVLITTPVFAYAPEMNYGEFFTDWVSITLIGDNNITDFYSSLPALSFNQRQTAKTYDFLSAANSGDLDAVISLIEAMDNDGKKNALAQASGYFLANVIRSAAVDAENNEIYDRIKNHCLYGDSEDGVWAQFRGAATTYSKDENSLNDFNDTSSGVMAGFDRFMEDKKIMLGAYGKYNSHNIEQGQNEAEIKNTGIGIYGGFIENKWEIKALVSGNYDSYNTKRYISFAGRKAKGEFNGATFGADIEGAMKFKLDEYIDLRPYAGIEAKNSRYGGFKEKDAQSLSLEVHGNSYIRSAARIGAGAVYDNNVFNWYVNAEAKYLLSGESPEVESIFEGSDLIFRSRGSTEGNMIFGAVVGASVRITKELKIFVNGSYYGADHFRNLYGNVGVRWNFCYERKAKQDKPAKNGKNDNYDPALYLLAPVEEEPKEMDAIITFEDAPISSQPPEDEYDPALELLSSSYSKPETEKPEEPKEEEYDAALALLNPSPEPEPEQEQPNMEDAKVVEEQQKEAALRRSKPVLKSFSLNMANFAAGKSVLTEKAKDNIRLQADEIKKFEFEKITIEGHTDSTGNAALNKKLSRERAKAVFDVFEEEGISPRKMSYIGFSSLLPVAPNNTKDGRAQNRRVEIFVE